jgi:hypothetical protein
MKWRYLLAMGSAFFFGMDVAHLSVGRPDRVVYGSYPLLAILLDVLSMVVFTAWLFAKQPERPQSAATKADTLRT